jgi:hypothetical protein
MTQTADRVAMSALCQKRTFALQQVVIDLTEAAYLPLRSFISLIN